MAQESHRRLLVLQCQEPLGMESGTIPDEDIEASSVENQYTRPPRARLNTLNTVIGQSGWRAAVYDLEQWIQVYLGGVKIVSGIITQGRDQTNMYVSRYEILLSMDGVVWQYITDTDGNNKIFIGNTDGSTAVTNVFSTTFQTSYVRIHPVEWRKHIIIRFEVLGCEDQANEMSTLSTTLVTTLVEPSTLEDNARTTTINYICIYQYPLGVEDGNIGSDKLTASSEANDIHGPRRGRLNTVPDSDGIGSWSAGSNDQNQWIQADLSTVKGVTGVVTQGRNDYNQWVTSYEVFHSLHDTFETVMDASGQTAEFTGNWDRDTPVTNTFYAPVYARLIRIHPTSWSGHISLRFELLGCPVIN
ncbi:lactadherin-like isoform X2 [Anneissia japonica]|uniref:lactadherin-like isoform X2 n=1 Tax=Anneissia japonica TaxID=1529436 RepID=UPI0014258A1F|nr:lactadherin-like isoform X2 [Anneissia japonica]XP_033097847.1 lactadherin-like isoform X2 [Anneissia japonica]